MAAKKTKKPPSKKAVLPARKSAKGATKTKPGVRNQTQALLEAVMEVNVLKVKQLLGAGANPTEIDPKEGISALFLALTEAKFRPALGVLLAWPKLKVNAVNKKDGRSSLHYLLNRWDEGDQLELTKRLLELGANPNIADKDGNTPLFLLTKFCELDGSRAGVLDLLVKSGADLEHQNDMDFTVMDHIFHEGMDLAGVDDKAAFMQLADKAHSAGAKLVSYKSQEKNFRSWLKKKTAQYVSEESRDEPETVEPDAFRSAFERIAGTSIRDLTFKTTTLQFGRKRYEIAFFDWFRYDDEQQNDKHYYCDQILNYHVKGEGEDHFANAEWVPFGLVGWTGSLDSYEDDSALGTLYLDLISAKGNDAPVVFSPNKKVLSTEDRVLSEPVMFQALMKTLKTK